MFGLAIKQNWSGAGYELETTSNKPEPVKDFGAAIPANPNLVDTQDELKSEILANPDKATLVDNRTWEEYIGETSGYSYHDKAGHIPGAVYGYAGTTDANSLEYFCNIDNTMRNFEEIGRVLQSKFNPMAKDYTLNFKKGSFF